MTIDYKEFAAQPANFTSQEASVLNYIAESKRLISHAKDVDPFVRHWHALCQQSGLIDKDGLIVLCAELIKQKSEVDVAVRNAVNIATRPLIIVATQDDKDAIEQLLARKDASAA